MADADGCECMSDWLLCLRRPSRLAFGQYYRLQESSGVHCGLWSGVDQTSGSATYPGSVVCCGAFTVPPCSKWTLTFHFQPDTKISQLIVRVEVLFQPAMQGYETRFCCYVRVWARLIASRLKTKTSWTKERRRRLVQTEHRNGTRLHIHATYAITLGTSCLVAKNAAVQIWYLAFVVGLRLIDIQRYRY